MQNKKNYIFIVVIFLFIGITSTAFSKPFDVYYNQGKDFFEQKDFPKAYEAFLIAFQLSPGNWEVDFLLGRSAFEIENYEMAIMAFERALITNPEMVRIKLEMARAYQRLGFNDMARKFCHEVLQTNPPDAVVKNINLFLSYIDKTEQRHFLKSSVIAGFDWTDNAWTTPSNSVINTRLGDVTLTGNSAQKKEDWITNLSAQISHRYEFPYQDTNWTTTGTFSRAYYSQEDELDMFYLAIETGPQLFSKKDMLGVSLVGDLIEINNERYQSSIGFKAFYRYLFNPTFSIAPSLQVKIKRNESNFDRNAGNLLFKLDTAYQFKNASINLQLALEDENARDDEFSYQKYAAKISFSRDLPWETDLFGSYTVSAANYEEAATLFSDPREDLIHQLGCGIKKKFWESANKQQMASFLLVYQYTQSESNIGLYDYQKNQIQSMVEYQF